MKTENKHFFLGLNHEWFPEEGFIIHLNEPRCFIRFDMLKAFVANVDEFYESIAEIQWIDGRPSEKLTEMVLKDAYQFFSIEKEILFGSETIKEAKKGKQKKLLIYFFKLIFNR